jgi:hypothetical protein
MCPKFTEVNMDIDYNNKDPGKGRILFVADRWRLSSWFLVSGLDPVWKMSGLVGVPEIGLMRGRAEPALAS